MNVESEYKRREVWRSRGRGVIYMRQAVSKHETGERRHMHEGSRRQVAVERNKQKTARRQEAGVGR